MFKSMRCKDAKTTAFFQHFTRARRGLVRIGKGKDACLHYAALMTA